MGKPPPRSLSSGAHDEGNLLLREINSAADRPSGVKDAVMDHG